MREDLNLRTPSLEENEELSTEEDDEDSDFVTRLLRKINREMRMQCGVLGITHLLYFDGIQLCRLPALLVGR